MCPYWSFKICGRRWHQPAAAECVRGRHHKCMKHAVRTCSNSCMLSMDLMLDWAVEATWGARERLQQKGKHRSFNDHAQSAAHALPHHNHHHRHDHHTSSSSSAAAAYSSSSSTTTTTTTSSSSSSPHAQPPYRWQPPPPETRPIGRRATPTAPCWQQQL